VVNVPVLLYRVPHKTTPAAERTFRKKSECVFFGISSLWSVLFRGKISAFCQLGVQI
jgi:hypothetical protein